MRKLLNVVGISGKEYAIFAVGNEDGTSRIAAAAVILDEHGDFMLADIAS